MEKSGCTVSWPELLTKEQQHLMCNFKHLCSAIDTLDNNITLTELETDINSLKDSAPGEDQIHKCMFRNTPQEFLEIMLFYFNAIWKTGNYPNEWKMATVIPILKPKKDRKINTYRPITLTSCYGKLFEIIINKILSWRLEKENLLNKMQFGFRPQRSTTDTILTVTEDIHSRFKNKKVTMAAMIGLESAFDKNPHYTITTNEIKCKRKNATVH
jgi:hypothetical protein